MELKASELVRQTPDMIAATVYGYFRRDYTADEIETALGGLQGIKKIMTEGATVNEIFDFMYTPAPNVFSGQY